MLSWCTVRCPASLVLHRLKLAYWIMNNLSAYSRRWASSSAPGAPLCYLHLRRWHSNPSVHHIWRRSHYGRYTALAYIFRYLQTKKNLPCGNIPVWGTGWCRLSGSDHTHTTDPRVQLAVMHQTTASGVWLFRWLCQIRTTHSIHHSGGTKVQPEGNGATLDVHYR